MQTSNSKMVIPTGHCPVYSSFSCGMKMLLLPTHPLLLCLVAENVNNKKTQPYLQTSFLSDRLATKKKKEVLCIRELNLQKGRKKSIIVRFFFCISFIQVSFCILSAMPFIFSFCKNRVGIEQQCIDQFCFLQLLAVAVAQLQALQSVLSGIPFLQRRREEEGNRAKKESL